MASLGSFYSPNLVIDSPLEVSSNVFGRQFLTSQEQKILFANIGSTLSPNMLKASYKIIPKNTLNFSWGS